jgi:phosphoglycolate phosphatase
VTPAILFDLDGTLVDSYPGIADAYRFTFDALRLDGSADLDLHDFVGPSIREVLKDHFGLSGSRLEEGVQLFRSHYGSEGLYRFSKYEGVEAMLMGLKDSGYQLCIATGKLWTMAVQVVEHAGWTELFSVIGGAKPDGSRYLKRDVIAWTLDQIAPGTAALAMVGDRAADIVGGRDLGLRGVGVTWGYGTAAELTEAGATIIVDSVDDLLTALSTYR